MQLTIGALKQAAAWPDTDQRTLTVLASQFVTAEPYQEGLKYLVALPDAAPAGTLWQALVGPFESRLGGRIREAIAKLDTATDPSPRMPPYSGKPRWSGSQAAGAERHDYDTLDADLLAFTNGHPQPSLPRHAGLKLPPRRPHLG